ncbi:MAG: tRNA glutamyl-Q(34) synthetase GluQRS [Pelagibacterales bacterium]|nr:tRNA glutamyl-Q(34) synthetase GluQRS [Pelagibacterales bacterium]PPR15914.1 MAG: Glutamate--tRNA ligase [Alphaproteobacteria bacterium MarineAlpha9_Bin3]|tara:strand:+ start:6753 stop:7637 length:885 start_codon:yes stop_codon:yes gene_type:complete
MKLNLYSNNTRFAPSPTGHMHLGHVFSALFAYEAAKKLGGKFILRIEDIDAQRSSKLFEDSIYEDLDWLEINFSKEIRYQSEHMQDYKAAINELLKLDMVYPCFCSRSEIKAEILRAGNAPHEEDYSVYPGTCRRLSLEDRKDKMEQNLSYAWRLNIRAASKKFGNLFWDDMRLGKHTVPVGIIGDIVLARKDIPTSYHLSATLDDHIQRIGLVTRGEDLVNATHIHKILQTLLGLKSPKYLHHPLILDSNGVRLSKRTRAQTIKSLKASGLKREDVIDLFGKENILTLLNLIK